MVYCCEEDSETVRFGVGRAGRESEEGEHRFGSFKIKLILMGLDVCARFDAVPFETRSKARPNHICTENIGDVSGR